MTDIRVSVGVWYLGATSDRFVRQGYRPDKTMLDRFKLAASIPGVGGLEMHYPTEVTDANYKELKQAADDLGLKIVQFCPHLWVDPRWKFGQFSNPDPRLRREAIDLAKRTTDVAQYMQAEIMVYWPAQDGYDYPFQVDHAKRLDDLIAGLAEWLDYLPTQKIVLEYKAWEPRSRIMLPTVGHCMTVVNEINRPNFGVNLDVGHALIMKENLAESFALIGRYKKLFHTHWNDNWTLFDDDVIAGSVNTFQMLEALFWLREWGYTGWYGLDLFPYREDPARAADESIRNLKFGFEMLDRVPKEALYECFRSSDAIRVAQLQRQMLGGR